MSPRKAIIEKDEASNIELQAGDIVTIFSQRDISVPQQDRSQYVIIEGEVMRPGVYKLENNETMRSVLERAGGLTPNAYVYGSQLTRESARVDQQKSLDELAHTMEVQIRQSALSVAASSNPGDLPQMLQAQEAMIMQLRNTRASGRVALPCQAHGQSSHRFPRYGNGRQRSAVDSACSFDGFGCRRCLQSWLVHFRPRNTLGPISKLQARENRSPTFTMLLCCARMGLW